MASESQSTTDDQLSFNIAGTNCISQKFMAKNPLWHLLLKNGDNSSNILKHLLLDLLSKLDNKGKMKPNSFLTDFSDIAPINLVLSKRTHDQMENNV
jgi:hypothetical protein